MSDPPRLLFDDAASGFAKELVKSWDDVRPDAEGRNKTLMALGVAGVLSTAALAAGKTAGAGSGAAAGGSVAPKAIAGGIAWLKWIALGAVVAGAGLGGVVAWSGGKTPTRSAAPAASSDATPPLPVVVLPAPPVAPPATTAVVAAPPTDTGAAIARPPIARTHSGRIAPTTSLDEQLAAVERARAALDQGDPIQALALLDAYEARYRDGAFIQEGEVLRVQALVRRGDRAGAERVGERFLAVYPKSPHAARVRALLDTPR